MDNTHIIKEKFQNKLVYGSLADKKMVGKITKELSEMGIVCDHIEDDKGMFHLYVYNQADMPKAIDHFRVLLGFKKRIEIPKEWENIKKLPLGNFTFLVLIICILIYFFGYFMEYRNIYDILMFGPKELDQTFSQISSGEYWRIITPAFIHFGLMHILFNLLWWKDLGNILENTKGPMFLFFFLILTAISSNLLQAYMVGANFGGLSGVVYGLLGYLWIYGLVNKKAKFTLPKSDIVLMIGWFVLCLFDVFSFGVANWAHGGGLLLGMIFGLIVGRIDLLNEVKAD